MGTFATRCVSAVAILLAVLSFGISAEASLIAYYSFDDDDAADDDAVDDDNDDDNGCGC